MMRRKTLLVLLLVTAVIAACAPAAPAVVETPSGESALGYQGQLTLIPLGGYVPPEDLTDAQKAAGATGNPYMAELIAEWEEMNPGINIVIEGVPQAPAGAQTDVLWYVKTAVAAGEGADIFYMYGTGNYDGEEGDKGLLVPLEDRFLMPNPYIPSGQPGSERWVDQWYNGFDGILAQGKSVKGHYYSIPLETAAPSLIYYNKTVLDELGLQFPSPSTNVTKLVDLLQKLQEAGYDPPMQIMCCSPGRNWDQLIFEHSILEPLALEGWKLDYREGFSDRFVEPEEFARAITKGLFSATDERFKETLRIEKLWVPYVSEEWKTGQVPVRADFITGKVPVRMSGSWEAETILGNPEVVFEVGVAPGPVVGMEDSPLSLEETPGPFVGGASGAFVVNAATMKRGTTEAAIDFLQFLTANWSHAVKGNPGLIPVIQGVEPNIRAEVREAGEAHIPRGYMRFSTIETVDSAAKDETYVIMTEYYLDRITLDKAAERIQDVWERWAERAIQENSVEAGGNWDLSQW